MKKIKVENRIFSTDSPKAIKADKYGFVNAIHYMAPAETSGTNLCPKASAACKALCLGWYSGQAGMLSDRMLERGRNEVRKSRIQKARLFMSHRADYLLAFVRAIDSEIKHAAELGKKLCVRPNGSTDIAFEGIRFDIQRDKRGRAVSVTLNGNGLNVFDHYPTIDFVDYTKIARRFDRALAANYHLTFSRSEANESEAIALLSRGVNVAVVFETKPQTWNGFECIDGDQHDLRHLDPRAARGFVVALSPKGRKAKRDQSGFVVRSALSIDQQKAAA